MGVKIKPSLRIRRREISLSEAIRLGARMKTGNLPQSEEELVSLKARAKEELEGITLASPGKLAVWKSKPLVVEVYWIDDDRLRY